MKSNAPGLFFFLVQQSILDVHLSQISYVLKGVVCLLGERRVVWESSDAHTEPHIDRKTHRQNDTQRFASGMALMIKPHDQWLKCIQKSP